ncbi:transcriptional regulator [Kineococcus sp. T13]|uniref:winged helix-turn-helix transcriptional regulator n=1 Tax=Kineococcus vitellinus TaxID=2696565 RepID=UPI001411D810|nr:helix-turn-helix domain-containing protein [Kineococcus vitellinus]NAZ75246.1 transcriptional regulator [Kineococcus vitellinus]
MGAPYHQFCPVAKTMELLDERWTVLLVRELVLGSTRFGELRRGLPRMSPTLLSRRLHQLAAAGLVQRREAAGEVRYVLTEAGRDLEPVVRSLSTWGARWIGELGDRDLDPKLLLWDMHRRVDARAVPAGRSVVEVRFSDVPEHPTWWLVVDSAPPSLSVDVCDRDPGHEPVVRVRTSLRCLTDVWRGALSWEAALRSQRLRLLGESALCRRFPGWFALPEYAVPAPAPAPAPSG